MFVVSASQIVADGQTTRQASVIYVPKVKGQPKARTDGATRGGGKTLRPVVRVVMPEEAAVTTTEQPTLYWHLNQPTPLQCDVLIKTADDEPLCAERFDASRAAGLIAFDLAKTGKRLKAGQAYRFAVLVSIDPNDPAGDIESSGTIRYEAAPEDVRQQLASARPLEKAAAYAGGGYFTDAVDTLMKAQTNESKVALDALMAQAKLTLTAE